MMKLLALSAPLLTGGVAIAACGSAADPPSRATVAKLTPCPQSPGLPALPGGLPGGVSLPIAKTIRPSNTSTSIVITPGGPQIQCGQTKLATYDNVVYSTPTTNGTTSKLEMNIQVPKAPGRKPLVVFITGGGFVLANNSANLNQRTLRSRAT